MRHSKGVSYAPAGDRLKKEILGHHFDYRFQRLAVSHAIDGVGNTLVAIALAGTLFFSLPTGEAQGRVFL